MSSATVSDDLCTVEVLLAQGRSDAAVALLERLAFMNPDQGEIWERLTGALIGLGEYERAAITSFAFEALAPSPQAYLMRSEALLHVEPQEALPAALSAQAADPTNWAAHAQVARCHLVGLDAAGRGLQAAQQAVALAPDEARAHAVLAMAYRRHERYDEAEKAAGKALSIDPRNVEAHDLLQALTLLTRRERREANRRPGQGRATASRAVQLPLLAFAVVLALLVPASAFVLSRVEPVLVAVVVLVLGCLGLLLVRLRVVD